MKAQKHEIDVKAKVAPVVTSLESDQKPKTSESQVPMVIPQSVAAEKIEKEKKSQAAKKGGKGQQTVVKEQPKVPIETQPTVPSVAKVNDGEAKDKKVKEAKVKKQVAVEPVAPELGVAEASLVPQKSASEKAAKMKRLTLDIAKPLHKAIKAKAVEEGVPMVDMLRSLLEEHYSK